MEDRPHRAEWKKVTSGTSAKNSKGYPVAETPGQAMQAACRFYPSSGKPKEYKNEDQTVSKEQGKIRFNLGQELPAKGQRISVYEGTNHLFSGEVKEVYKGSNATPWVKV